MAINQNKPITRRGFFRTAGVVGAVVASSGLIGGPLRHAQAEETPAPAQAAAPTVDMDALIAQHMGPGAITLEKVGLDVPATAENAALVRIPIVVDHPMEAGNYIQTVGLFVDNNPNPFVAQFDFTPEAGKAAVEFRIRMAGPSKVRIIAKNNTGKLYGLIKEIQVAAGGCAG